MKETWVVRCEAQDRPDGVAVHIELESNQTSVFNTVIGSNSVEWSAAEKSPKMGALKKPEEWQTRKGSTGPTMEHKRNRSELTVKDRQGIGPSLEIQFV